MEKLTIFLLYIICSLIAGFKQSQVNHKITKWNEDESALIGKIFATLAFLFGPIWLSLAIIRQVFFEKWQ